MPLTSAISLVSQRWVICILCSVSIGSITFRRVCFYETYNVVEKFTFNQIKLTGGCPYVYSKHEEKEHKLPFYLLDVFWNPYILDKSMSAYRIGRCFMAVPAGMLSDLGYSRYILGGGMFLVTISNILLPTAAEFGATVFVFSSFVEGIGEGTILPSVISLITRWSPYYKRNTFTVLVVAGLYYGNTLGHIFFNLNYRVSNSWAFGKYSNGSLGIVWLIFWIVFGYHSPAVSPFNSQHDRFTTTCHRMSVEEGLHRLGRIPWKNIVSSRPFLSVVILYCSFQSIVNSNIDDILQNYEISILHLPQRFSESSSIVIVSGLPTSLMGGLLNDWVIKHELISDTVIKKILVFITLFFSSVTIVSATLVGCSYILFWIMTGTTIYVVGLADSAIFASPIDLSPRNAGLLMGIMVVARTLVTLSDITIDGILTLDQSKRFYWQIISTFNVIVAFVLVIPFFVFGSANKQRWDRRTRQTLSTSPAILETHEEPNPGNSLNFIGDILD